jgi:hypothetical protein
MNPLDGSIVASPWGSDVFLLLKGNKNFSIKAPDFNPSTFFYKICNTNEIWAIWPAKYTAIYNFGAMSWIPYTDSFKLENPGSCYVTPDNKLFLWEGNKMILVGDEPWTSPSFPATEIIGDVFQDKSGILWIFTAEGGLNHPVYRLYKTENGNWVKAGELKLGDMMTADLQLVTSDGMAWINITELTKTNKLYTWDLQDEPNILKLILELTEPEMITGVYEDSKDTIWIGTTEGILTQSEGNLESVALPFRKQSWLEAIFDLARHHHLSRVYVHDTAFYHRTDRLYLGADDGIYYLDTINFISEKAK